MMLSVSELFTTFSVSPDCVTITVTGVTLCDCYMWHHITLSSKFQNNNNKEKKLKNKIKEKRNEI